ncbi:late embryogenesis abundant protein At5g17165-like [Juglans microcarpa x Juglans regia]|uniref:late embryogenesis abundant protein At5g17165-like n=1 Tax=Juglans microcarpa x Juglans regia TaxID=2249226 RepID=UPI001B7DD669|nr:late embryogenesis abundant protein At5g17165-like [Juglans microcarpa x Juglans regia]
MAANTKTPVVVALSFGKRFFNLIWAASNPRHPSLPSPLSTITLRRAEHTSVYDKNPEDHTPNVVPDYIISPQSETYWAPHPQTGVFGPSTEQTSTVVGERGFHSSFVNGGEGSVLEEKAWFHHTGVEDLEKPHAL